MCTGFLRATKVQTFIYFLHFLGRTYVYNSNNPQSKDGVTRLQSSSVPESAQFFVISYFVKRQLGRSWRTIPPIPYNYARYTLRNVASFTSAKDCKRGERDTLKLKTV